jgi:hypothetical protein
MQRKNIKLLLLSLITITIFLACAKKIETVVITGWEKLNGDISRIAFDYPQGWTISQDQNGVTVYSSPEVITRFTDLNPMGPDGIRLMVTRTKLDTLINIDQYVEKTRKDLSDAGYEVTAVENRMLASVPGKSYQGTGYLDKRNKLSAIKIFAMKDSMLYTASYEGFNILFENSKFILDTLLTSLKFTETAPKVVAGDPALPSANFIDFSNNYLSLKYPDNFELNTPAVKAPAEFALDIRGYRQDSFVHLDITPAKGLSPEKVVLQNSKFYKSTSKGSVTIDGVKTTYLDYRPMKDINSRVYFLVKNDRFFRIIFNYYTPMKEKFLNTFEKVVSSITVK